MSKELEREVAASVALTEAADKEGWGSKREVPKPRAAEREAVARARSDALQDVIKELDRQNKARGEADVEVLLAAMTSERDGLRGALLELSKCSGGCDGPAWPAWMCKAPIARAALEKLPKDYDEMEKK